MKQESKQLLLSLGRVLVRKGPRGLQHLAALVSPFGSAILAIAEIAQETWREYSRSVAQVPVAGVPGEGGPVQPAPVPELVEIDLRIELESLAGATPAAVRQQVEQVAQEVAGDQPPELRQALANYLAQVPAMLRRCMRRPSDPTGTTLPGNLLLRKGEDLVALLPPRPPRFKSGDQPLPGVPWVLDELLGVGGFGEVWKAHHADNKGLLVALKFCLDEKAAETLRNEFELLVQVMEQGQLEGIIQLRNAYNMKKGNAGTPCLEYEYVAGGDLAGLIQELHQKGRPSTEVTGKIVRRLAAIIGTVHQLKPPIVHRDLKPANILVQKTPAGKFQFKVADFGIGQVTAREAIQSNTRGGEDRAGVLTALVHGSYTPLYASPQQVRGDKAHPRDDVYSLGVIWYQLLTGDLGSGAPSGMRWAKDLAHGGMPLIQIDLLASCFESNPADRPANAAVLAEQLSPEEPRPVFSKTLVFGLACGLAELFFLFLFLFAGHWYLASLLAIPPAAALYAWWMRKRDLRTATETHPSEHRTDVEGRPRPEEHGKFPIAEEAHRQGDAAALWFLRAGIGNLAVLAGILAIFLRGADWKFRLGRDVIGFLLVVMFPGGAATCHFLASGSLKNFRSKAKVITAIIFGFVVGVLCVFGAIGLGISLGVEDRHTPKTVVFVLFLVVMPTSLVNFFAAIRGILVLGNAGVSQEFGRPENTREKPRPVLSKNQAIGLAGGLAAWFFLVLLLAFSTWQP